jgi:hypothetical protein
MMGKELLKTGKGCAVAWHSARGGIGYCIKSMFFLTVAGWFIRISVVWIFPPEASFEVPVF